MAYVQKVQRKTGTRYRMFWRSPDPKMGTLKLRSKDFVGSGGKSEALREARLLEAKDTRRPLTTEGNGTIRDFLASWEPTATIGLAPGSAYNVRWAIKRINLWVGDTKLDKFSALTLANVTRQATAEGIAPITLRRIMRTFKKAIKAAINWQLLPPDAQTILDNAEPIRVAKKRIELRSIEETTLLADTLRPTNPAVADILIIAAYTGLRYGEIAALSWEQVSFAAGTLKVDRTLSKDENLAYIVKMSPKTEAGNRTIPMSPEVIDVLTRQPTTPLTKPNANRTGLIFTNSNGNPIQGSTAAAPVRKAAAKLGVPQGFHCSRHYWASLMISRNVPLTTISRLLGHSSVRVTMEEYAHFISDPTANDAVLEALSGSVPVARNRQNSKN